MPGRSYTSARRPPSTAARPYTPTVTPCQFPVLACPPVRALNSVLLPQFGLPANRTRGTHPENSARFLPRRPRPRGCPPLPQTHALPNARFRPASCAACATAPAPHADTPAPPHILSPHGGAMRGNASFCAAAHMRGGADTYGSGDGGAYGSCKENARGSGACGFGGAGATSMHCASERRTARRTPSASNSSPPPNGARRNTRTRRPAATFSLRSRSAAAKGRAAESTNISFPHSALSSFIPIPYADRHAENALSALSFRAAGVRRPFRPFRFRARTFLAPFPPPRGGRAFPLALFPPFAVSARKTANIRRHANIRAAFPHKKALTHKPLRKPARTNNKPPKQKAPRRSKKHPAETPLYRSKRRAAKNFAARRPMPHGLCFFIYFCAVCAFPASSALPRSPQRPAARASFSGGRAAAR